MNEQEKSLWAKKVSLAEALKGGVIMDVTNADQAKIAEDAGAVAVMALERVPADHAIFSTLHAIDAARYTAAVLQAQPELAAPVLEGIVLDGDLRVIYSPFDIACGWLGCDYPLAKAYDSDSATRLGMNLLVYAMTH